MRFGGRFYFGERRDFIYLFFVANIPRTGRALKNETARIRVGLAQALAGNESQIVTGLRAEFYKGTLIALKDVFSLDNASDLGFEVRFVIDPRLA